MYKYFKYRLYPSKSQAKRLESVRETCRYWYNECLAERKSAWEERRETIGKYSQLAGVKDYKATNSWAAKVHSHVLQVVVADLDKANPSFDALKPGISPATLDSKVVIGFPASAIKNTAMASRSMGGAYDYGVLGGLPFAGTVQSKATSRRYA